MWLRCINITGKRRGELTQLIEQVKDCTLDAYLIAPLVVCQGSCNHASALFDETRNYGSQVSIVTGQAACDKPSKA